LCFCSLCEIKCIVANILIVNLHMFCFFSYISDNVLQIIHVIHEFRVVYIDINLECCIVISLYINIIIAVLFLFILQIIPIKLSQESVLVDFLNLAFLLIDAFCYFFCKFFVVFWIILSEIIIFLQILFLLFFIQFLFLILLLLRLRVTVVLKQLFLFFPKIIVVHNRLFYRLKYLYVPLSLLLIWLHIPLFRFLSFNHRSFLSRFLLLFTRSHRCSII